MAKRTPRQQSDDTSTAVMTAPRRRTRTGSRVLSGPWAPTEDDIRARAYCRFLARGATHGHDFDDWLEAEKELKG